MFQKPIPDPTEHPPQGSKSNTQYLHLKRSFYETVRDPNYYWQMLPICKSIQKLRLENTKVKADGASVVLYTCKAIYSLGYLVFAAAGLKNVFGYEDCSPTKFTEIFYRGPSDQKLQTIQNTCPALRTMFLGSNSIRHLNAAVFSHWPHLKYLTLENIIVDDVSACLELIGNARIKILVYPKIHIFKIAFFDRNHIFKVTFFDRIHIFKVSFFAEFTF